MTLRIWRDSLGIVQRFLGDYPNIISGRLTGGTVGREKERRFLPGQGVEVACSEGWRPSGGVREAVVLFEDTSGQHGKGGYMVQYPDGRRDCIHRSRLTLADGDEA